MLFVDRVRTSPKQLFDLVAIRCVRRSVYTDVTGLQLVRSMGEKPAKDDVVFKAVCHHLKRLMCTKAVVDQHTRLPICS